MIEFPARWDLPGTDVADERNDRGAVTGADLAGVHYPVVSKYGNISSRIDDIIDRARAQVSGFLNAVALAVVR